MFKKLISGVLLAALAITAIAPATVSAKGWSDKTIADQVGARPYLSTLFAAVACTQDVLDAAVNPDAQLTVFAPTNRSFRELGRDLGIGKLNARNVCDKLDDATRLSVLTYHVVAAEVKFRDALKLATRKGTTVGVLPNLDPFNPVDATRTVDLVQRGWFRLFVDGNNSDPARVIRPNIDASNGVVHVINEVLLP